MKPIISTTNTGLFSINLVVCQCKPAPGLNPLQEGAGGVSLDPNYPLVKVLRAPLGHE